MPAYEIHFPGDENAVTSGRWKVNGHADLTEDLQKPVRIFYHHLITGKLSIPVAGEEFAATVEDCIGLDSNAVWDVEHVEDRILDEINGRPNKWMESLKLKLNRTVWRKLFRDDARFAGGYGQQLATQNTGTTPDRDSRRPAALAVFSRFSHRPGSKRWRLKSGRK